MNIILFDDHGRNDLLPLCYTRPCGDMRLGILTIQEKWQHHLSQRTSWLTQDYLKTKYTTTYTKDNTYINGRLLPDENVLSAIKNLTLEHALVQGDIVLAYRTAKNLDLEAVEQELEHPTQYADEVSTINFCYDIFSKNGTEIEKDFALLTKGRISASLSSTNTVIGDQLFVEEGAEVEAAILNTTKGPIYIGKNSTIMEGAMIRGPHALCEGATIKMGAKIYGDSTIGPQCKVGGEVSNTVFFSNSNKGHDGFIGNSVVGEWCNLGADTNSSNLKNNYAFVKLWNYTKKRFINTELQFCGLIMGDHSKCGINTMFNTGTVVGVSANIFGASFPRNFIPSFTWGGATGFATYSLNKAYETVRIVMLRRNQELNEIEKDILAHVHATSSEHRIWEKQTSQI